MSEKTSRSRGEPAVARAEDGDPQAQFELACSLAEGPAPNLVESARVLRLAAERGLAAAQYSLGVRFLNGQGVPENVVEAVHWLRRAAEQGHPGAQDSMGVRYATGQGVPTDEAEAFRWFHKAAEQGHVVAQFNLGLAYAQGNGTQPDPVRAYAWFCLSAEQGDVVATGAVETLVESFSLEQLKRARKLFHELFNRYHRKEQGKVQRTAA